MKKIQYLSIFLIFYCIDVSGQNTFLDNVTSDKRFYGPYVVVPAFIDSSFCNIAVKNKELYSFLLYSDIVDSSGYSAYVLSIINGERSFYYSQKKRKKIERLDFEVINIPDSVRNIAEKGKDFFINYYFFDKSGLKEEYMQYKTAIIYFLFKWEIPVTTPCETGGLHISDFEKP